MKSATPSTMWHKVCKMFGEKKHNLTPVSRFFLDKKNRQALDRVK